MSGVVHSVKKVFSKVWDFVRPIVEVVAIAAAVYFTAGVAMSYFGPTAAFAASMPGFAANGVAGAGIFSSAASSIGLGGGLAAGAATANAGAAAAGFAEVSAAALQPAAVAAAGDTGAGLASAQLASGFTGVAGAAAGAAAPAASTAAAAGMSLTDKLMLASVGTNAISGFMSPTPADIQKAKNGWYGAFYGVDSNGQGSAAPSGDMGPQSEPGRTYGEPASSAATNALVPAANTPPPAVNASMPNMGSGANMGAGANMGTLQPPAMPSLMPPAQKQMGA